MSAGKRVRWECPTGDHPGVLGSTRPPKDATVRFCLPCSEAAGRLVPRTAPALERQRAQRTSRSSEKAQAKRERDAAAKRAAYVVMTSDGETIDLHAEMMDMMKRSEELRSRRRESGRPSGWRAPELTVRRGTKGHVSGHCDGYTGDIVLTVGAGADSYEVREVLMHELVHAVTMWLVPRTKRGRGGREWHGRLFRTALCRSARELFGTSVHPDDHAEAYGLDDLILQEMRQGTGRKTEVR